MPNRLTDLERDALTELVNIGVSRSATNLSRMLSEQVILSVPSVDIVSRSEAAHLVASGRRDSFVAVGQEFEGSFSGRALLIFPEESSQELAHSLLDDTVGQDALKEMEQDALREVGNVILNGCLTVVANTLRENLDIKVPYVTRGDAFQLFAPDGAAEGLVIFLYVDFSVKSRSIRGYIALAIDHLSIEQLKAMVNGYIRNVL
ncbi:chemotaxis protein CheX [Azospirillum sp. SYSU D00513]|uniref:chemotaxis protein CheX n=1 Tax=Azospirillum sp. SYSU D00513 TaxID=2812561 RepID=UPI001A964206|nr:chemotaxis protein CheX [Azospirillum sp. SYSU D00513]